MFIVMINPVLEPMGPFTPSLFRFSWHEVTRVLLLPPAPSPPPHGMPVPLKVPPALFHQASLTTCKYSFKLPSRERHCEIEVFCPSTQHQIAWPGVQPRPLDQESSALSIRSLNICGFGVCKQSFSLYFLFSISQTLFPCSLVTALFS